MGMRIIKFRGLFEGEWWYSTPDKDCWQQFWIITEKESRTQYTGRKDKNSVEIYEGDIVSLNSNGIFPMIVKYDRDKAQFMFHGHNYIISKNFRSHLGTKKARQKVIGNLMENPELLKGE